MTLSFSTKWPERMRELAGQPNYFIEKIWEGFFRNATNIQEEKNVEKQFLAYSISHDYEFGKDWDELPNGRLKSGKLHTIRSGDRWKAGMKIHPVINNRTPNRFQFAPTLECKGVQEIEIIWAGGWPRLVIDGKSYFEGFETQYEVIEKLAINDGFPSVDAFFQYFNEDFKGQLIHWTDLKY